LLIVDHSIIAAAAVLALGAALLLLASWRGWRPRLRTALAVGAALRVAAWGLAATGLPPSGDFASDFPAAALAVLHHQDPVLSNPGRWHILPLMPFVLAAELKVGQLAHVAWPVIGKLAPVAADLVLIPLVGRLAGERGPLARFQYACNPVSIAVCAIHGQLEPVSLALGVGAFLAARSGRASTAGILGGLSASTGGWPVLLLPGILLTLPRWRQRQRAAVWAAAVPSLLLVSSPLTVGTPVRQLPHVARLLVGARSVVGDWGWTAVATGGLEHAQTALARPGKLILLAALLAAAYLWRRADPVDLTTALLITFLLATPRLGVQYLMFPVPFLVARGGRSGTAAVLASAAWAGVGYLYIAGLHAPVWYTAHQWWALSSLAVMGCLLAAMPWARCQRQRTEAALDISGSLDSSDVGVPADVPADGPWRSANST
jgi:hypothetical protein